MVVGGGPAGCAAALTLLRHSERRVVVIERGDYATPRVGETLGPGHAELLRYLGLQRRFEAAGHAPGLGSSAVWGDDVVRVRHFLFTGRGRGVHLDRGRFDAFLAAAVEEAGGRLLRRHRPIAVAPHPAGGYELEVDGDGRRRTIRGHFVVDAGGKAAPLARRLGAVQHRDDELVGIIGFAVAAPGPLAGQTFVEARPDGWWYTAELPGRRLVLAFMTDPGVARERRLGEIGPWCDELWEARHTRARAVPRSLAADLIVRAAGSRRLAPPAGERWIAIGDAAASFDPLSGMGIGTALVSGMHGARAVDAALAGEPALVEAYGRQAGRTYAEYRRLHRQFYSLERRWPERAFWARRRGEGDDRGDEVFAQ